MVKKLFILFIFLLATVLAKAQNQGVVQLSGALNSTDTAHKAIPFATVYDLRTGIITISNYDGFFSIVALEGDTIAFSSLGFKTRLYVVPANMPNEKLYATLMLDPAYLVIAPVVIYPWGTRDQFPNAFVHTPVPDDDLARAKHNLSPDIMRAMLMNAPVDPDINARVTLNNYAASLYYYGQPHPISLLNPIAWSQFISDLKSGKYKNPNNQ